MAKGFIDYLKDESDGTTIQANGNYATVPAKFSIQCPTDSDDSYEINRVIIFIKDTQGIDADKYGNGITLANGIEVEHIASDGATVKDDLTGGLPIKSNGDWARLCYDVQLLEFGTGNEIVSVRWTLEKTGKPLILGPGEYLRFTLSDDFSGLIEHTFNVQGLDRV